MNLSFEFLLKMTFRVMNKVMNNLKNLCNSTVIQSVNENVNPFTLLKIIKSPVFTGLFFCPNILLEHEESTKKARRKKSSNESII